MLHSFHKFAFDLSISRSQPDSITLPTHVVLKKLHFRRPPRFGLQPTGRASLMRFCMTFLYRLADALRRSAFYSMSSWLLQWDRPKYKLGRKLDSVAKFIAFA